ncbi:TPA: hypothetical protein ACIA0S_001676, partial [Salmonella enterica subsp. houtenae serovar [1],40:z4,z23:-]
PITLLAGVTKIENTIIYAKKRTQALKRKTFNKTILTYINQIIKKIPDKNPIDMLKKRTMHVDHFCQKLSP